MPSPQPRNERTRSKARHRSCDPAPLPMSGEKTGAIQICLFPRGQSCTQAAGCQRRGCPDRAAASEAAGPHGIGGSSIGQLQCNNTAYNIIIDVAAATARLVRRHSVPCPCVARAFTPASLAQLRHHRKFNGAARILCRAIGSAGLPEQSQISSCVPASNRKS